MAFLSPSSSLTSDVVAKLRGEATSDADDVASGADFQVRFNSTPHPSTSMEDEPGGSGSLVVTSRQKLLRFINDQKLEGKSKRMFRRMLGLCMSFLMMLTAGSLLSFNAYSDALKLKLNLDQNHINIVLSSGNIGLLLGFTGGAMFDWKGPKYTSAIAALLTFAGYMMMFLTVINPNFAPNILTCIGMFLVGQGSNFSYSAALQTQLINFPPKHRGKAIGFIDSMFGGSAAFFSVIYATTFGKSSDYSQQHLAGFFLFLAIFIGSVNFLGVFVLKKIQHKNDFDDLDSKTKEEVDPLLVSTFSINGEPTTNGENDNDISVEKTPLQLVKTMEFWVFFFVLSIIIGLGLTFQGNIGFFLQAAQLTDLTKLLSIVTPVLSLTLRLLIGFVSDLLLTSVSRSVWISLGCAFVTAAWAIISVALESRIGMIMACISMGAGYGMVACIAPTYVSECWGVVHIGKNFGMVVLGVAFTTLTFQAFVGYVYSHAANGAANCFGENCYQLSSIVAAALCFAAIVLSIFFGAVVRRKKTVTVTRL